MKKFIIVLMILAFTIPLMGQESFRSAGKTSVRQDTTLGSKAFGRLISTKNDSLLWMGLGFSVKQIATWGDTIALAKLKVDTLTGFSNDSIFTKADMVFLQDVLISQGAGDVFYVIDSGGDTIFTLDANNVKFIISDATAADSVYFTHDGTDFKLITDAGTGKIDFEDTFEADSIRSEDGNFVFSPTTDKTTMLMCVATDSFRVTGTSRLIGTVTAGATATPVVISTTGDVTAAGKVVARDSVTIGKATATDQVVPYFRMKGDADSDPSATTSETLTIGLSANSTPANASWDISTSQPCRLRLYRDANNYFQIRGDENYMAVGGTVWISTPTQFYAAGEKNIGALTAPFGTSYISNYSYIGGKDKIAKQIITKANNYTAADSSIYSRIYLGNGRTIWTSGDADSAIVTCDNDSARLISNNPWSIAGGITNTGNALLKGTVTVENPMTVGKNTGTSGQINFVASDNDQGTMAITTADALSITNFSGGILSYNNLDPGSADNYTLGSSAGWKQVNATDYITLGGKGQTAEFYISTEREFTGADSSLFGSVVLGVPIWRFNGSDGDQYQWSINTSDEAILQNAAGLTLDTGTALKLGTLQWDVIGTDSINGAQIAARTITDLALPSLAGDVTGTLGANIVGNDSHDHSAAGSTVTINAADIIDKNAGTDITADLEEEVTEGSLADGVIVSDDIKAGTIRSNRVDSVGVDGITTNSSIDASSELANLVGDETGSGALVFGTAPTFTTSINVPLIYSTSPLTLDVTGTGNSYVEVIQDNNAGMLAVGRTTGTEYSMITVCDGGADNHPGFWQMLSDDGNGNYHWHATDHTYRVAASLPADDDAGGYAIIDADNGTIGASTQAVNGSTITGTTLTDGTISITGGALTGATNISNGTTTNGDGFPVTNWNTVKVYCDSTIAGEVTLTDVLPAGYTIETIIFKNTTANAITSLDIGFSDGGGEVVAAANVNASDEGSFTILQKIDDYDAVDTLYVSASNWNSGNLILWIRMHRMF